MGVDPGSTSGVAALNLEGELELRKSRREFARHEIIEEIVEAGRPVVMACDTAEMPSTVEKIASNLGARRFEPESNLTSERKEQLGGGDDSHEKDAHAAAEHAFRNLRKSIEKVNSRAGSDSNMRYRLADEFF